ncbi:MAG: RagB/SusD family nutrient uptake outer membrane protein [Rikenellaceae bacterium]|nr:RagB/SusD family nutrient uptake outer membrane protein [Rikenellaceae bacterium]
MKIIKFVLTGVLAGSIVSSCSSDWLETSPTEGIPETALSTAEDLYLALNGIHRKMVSADRGRQGQGGEPGFIICREVGGDDMTWALYTGWHTGNFKWTVNTKDNDSYNYHMWHTYYEFILNCNKILEQWELMSENEQSLDLARYVKGETIAFRAWTHFQLVQYYGFRYDAGKTNTQYGIPIKTSSAIEQLPRNTVEEVYEFINAELIEAAALLEGYKPVDINHYSEKWCMASWPAWP